jgi:hypothetical protein
MHDRVPQDSLPSALGVFGQEGGSWPEGNNEILKVLIVLIQCKCASAIVK